MMVGFGYIFVAYTAVSSWELVACLATRIMETGSDLTHVMPDLARALMIDRPC